MSHRSYCDLCHERYGSDNLMTYHFGNRDFCYHCGESGDAVCLWCLDKQRAGQPSA